MFWQRSVTVAGTIIAAVAIEVSRRPMMSGS